MALRRRDDVLAEEWVRLRDLRMTGRSKQACQLAERTIAESTDADQVTQALIVQLAVNHAAKNHAALLDLLRTVEERLDAAAHPRLAGQYHIFAAASAYDRRSFGIALRHAIEADRALHRMDERTRAAVDAWQDLAAIYIVLGYHDRASQAAQRSESLCREAGLPRAYGIAAYALVHAAVNRDQRGDTGGCVRELTEVVERAGPVVADLPVRNQVMLGYAIRRLAALGHTMALDVPVAIDLNPNLNRTRTLADVCEALGARAPDRALAVLDAATEPLDIFGKAEPVRLRSLALAQLGDRASALEAEREMQHVFNEEERELRRLLADSAGARIDQDQLRQSAERYARAALTDHLTGLCNKRRVDEFVAELVAGGTPAIIGMLDLDGFKAVNDTYGHPTGDIVLQRVAGILTREVRPNDVVARPGGDEFVVVLSDMKLADAEALGERLEAAVRGEDWGSIVPDTPVAVSVGWAELGPDIDASFRAADEALYRVKRERRARSAR